MKKIIIIISIIIFTGNFMAQNQKVLTGIEVLKKDQFEILKGKKVGLITNPTGVDNQLKSTIDILFEAEGIELVALFGPEHGVRGDYSAGEYVQFYKDGLTNLPVYSLYGSTRKPSQEMLEGIDVLVYDIQDIGCRSYTYISTMGLAMEAASEKGIKFVVLDRPNPLGGNKIEGNVVEDGYYSFVSQFKIPYVYGLTCGELALMLNEEKMLEGGVKCELEVVKMENWKRDMKFEETELQWVPTSPHVPHNYSAIHYVTTGILGELGVISEGVGYTIPFQTFASEWIDEKSIADELNKLKLDGVIFRPIVFKPYYTKHAGKTLRGVQVHIEDYSKVNLMSIQFLFMEIHNKLYPDKNPFELAEPSRLNMFDKVCGTDKIRELFSENLKFEEIEKYLSKDVESFRKLSKKYYLYD